MNKEYTKKELHAMSAKQLQAWLTTNKVPFETDANKSALVEAVWQKQNEGRLNGGTDGAAEGEAKPGAEDATGGVDHSPTAGETGEMSEEEKQTNRLDPQKPGTADAVTEAQQGNVGEVPAGTEGDGNKKFNPPVKQGGERKGRDELGEFRTRFAELERKVEHLMTKDRARDTQFGSIDNLGTIDDLNKKSSQ
ncbi:hypothetical protein EKK58_09240 [Candidatus Dependentiae bacterium]|nr:MAG: hypothetical protein EKK58_09240 [Candidatus Dependentiae bacterium]